jgi:hypothetical protein
MFIYLAQLHCGSKSGTICTSITKVLEVIENRTRSKYVRVAVETLILRACCYFIQ